MGISVCIIAKNEEKNIKKCLSSFKNALKDASDIELLVVDTGSEDDTVKIAKECGARVEFFEWINDFSAARNAAIDMAHYEYILFLDADEHTESMDIKEIKSLIKRYPEAIGRIERRNRCYSGADEECIMTDRVERLFSKSLYEYRYSIHEQVTRKDGKELEAYEIPLTVYHEGYFGSKEELKRKAQRNNDLLFKEMENSPEDPYLYYEVAQSFGLIGDKENEYRYYREGWKKGPVIEAPYTPIMAVGYGQSMIALDIKEELFDFIEKNQIHFCEYSDYMCMAGYAYMKYGMFEKAIWYYQRAIGEGWENIEGSGSYIPAHNLACIFEALGDEINAIKYFEIAGTNKLESEKRLEALKKKTSSEIYSKRISMILSVFDELNEVSQVLDCIENQSIGMGHIELIIVTSEKIGSYKLFTEFEKKYEQSVILIQTDDIANKATANKATAFETGLMYCSADNVMFVDSNSILAWDAVRTLCTLRENEMVDCVCADINYGDNDAFKITISDNASRENLRNAGIISKGYLNKIYKREMLVNDSINSNEILDGNIEISKAETILCMKNSFVVSSK